MIEYIKTGIDEFDRMSGGGIPKGSIILVEEELGVIKSIFAQKIADKVAEDGGKILYITQRPREDIEDQMNMYGLNLNGSIEFSDRISEGKYDLTVIDNFSITHLDSGAKEIADLMKNLKMRKETTLILCDLGVLHKELESATRAMVDGVIRFRFEDQKDKIYRTIIIPKFKNVVDAVIPFTVGESGILIDTRRRV